MGRVSRILLFLLLAIPALLVVAVPFLIGGFVWELSFKPAYDTQHPDYARYAAAINQAERELTKDGVSMTPFDFAPLNGGAWKTACLFGGYGKPIAEMRGRGAIISDADMARLDDKEQRGFRLFAVEEGEAVIAYIDNDNHAHFIHFSRGLGQYSQSPFHGCISKPLTTLILLAS